MHIKGAIFDCDGTLLDTEPLYDAAEEQLIEEFGDGGKLTSDIKKQINGTAPEIACKILVDTFHVNLTPKEFQKRRDALLVEPFRHSQFKKGARETTHKFKHELGLKVGIATSSVKKEFENKTNHLKDWLEEDIDVIVTTDDKRVKKGKPAPDIFLLGAKELGIEPQECIVFEDAISGVKAAISAGVAIVVAVMEEYQKDSLNGLSFDKNRTKLIVLDSMDQFDFSLIIPKK